MNFTFVSNSSPEPCQCETSLDDRTFVTWEIETLNCREFLATNKPITSTGVDTLKRSYQSTAASPRKTQEESIKSTIPRSRRALVDYTKERPQILGDHPVVTSHRYKTSKRSTTSIALQRSKDVARKPLPLPFKDDEDIQFMWVKRMRSSTRVNNSIDTSFDYLDDDLDCRLGQKPDHVGGDLTEPQDDDDVSEISLSLHDLECDEDFFKQTKKETSNQATRKNLDRSGLREAWRNGFIARQDFSTRSLFKKSQSMKDLNSSTANNTYSINGDGDRVEQKSLWASTRDLMQRSRHRSTHTRESQETLIRRMFSDLKSRSMSFDTETFSSADSFGETSFNEEDVSTSSDEESHCRPALRRLLTDLKTGKSSRNFFQ